jgi:flagellar biosynthesis protein FlhF
MQIKKFVGTDYGRLVKGVRQEFGKDAIILYEEMPQRRRGLLRLFGKPKYAIIAGSGFEIVKAFDQTKGREVHSQPNLLRKTYCADVSAPAPATAVTTASSAGVEVPQTLPPVQTISRTQNAELDDIRKMLSEIREQMHFPQGNALPDELFTILTDMIQNDVSRTLAQRLVANLRRNIPESDLRNREVVRAAAAAVIRDAVRVSNGIALKPGKSTVIAIVGPTGVGKTTTIAKLAANFAFRQKKTVGLITIDRFRIGGEDQLKRYADLMLIPMRAVQSPSELRLAVKAFADKDVVLIDTAGRSQRDEIKMAELKSFLDAASPDEVHLCVSLTSNRDTVMEIIERFSVYSFKAIIFTKLDEAVKFGIILDILSRMQAEISFLTVGQQVPSDLKVADRGQLTEMILGATK